MNNCSSGNVSSTVEERSIVVYYISALAVILVIPYIFALYIYYTNLKEFGNYAYHTCLFAVGVYDILTLLKIGIYDAIVDRDTASRDVFAVSWMLFYVLYFGQLWATTIMTINRTFSAIWWEQYDKIFCVKNTIVFNLLAAIGAIALAIPSGVPRLGIAWVNSCQGSIAVVNKAYMVTYMSIMTILIFGNLALYIALFIFIRSLKIDATAVDKSERKILYQSFFIVAFHCVMYMINGAVYFGVPYTLLEHPAYAISAINAGMNPFLYLKFSSKFQLAVLKIFKSVKRTTAISIPVSRQNGWLAPS